MSLHFRPIHTADARAILEWHYEPPYDIYNADPQHADEILAALLNPEYAYHSITNASGELVGFCCFGPDARVPGGDYRPAALDIGMGMRPDLTGQGCGPAFATAVLDFARQHFDPDAFRVTIAAFNRRAQRVWHKMGFRPVQHFEHHQTGRAFVILTRKAQAQ